MSLYQKYFLGHKLVTLSKANSRNQNDVRSHKAVTHSKDVLGGSGF